MKFRRKVSSQGLPKDYKPKPHHNAGYESIAIKFFRRCVVDVNGHRHAIINIEVLK